MAKKSADPIASALARKRWDKATKKERKAVGEQLADARRAAITPERRSEIARNAALARHGKKPPTS